MKSEPRAGEKTGKGERASAGEETLTKERAETPENPRGLERAVAPKTTVYVERAGVMLYGGYRSSTVVGIRGREPEAR